MPRGPQVRFQCPKPVHEGAVKPLRGPVALRVVGGGVGLGDASTQLFHNSTKLCPFSACNFAGKPNQHEKWSVTMRTFSIPPFAFHEVHTYELHGGTAVDADQGRRHLRLGFFSGSTSHTAHTRP